MKKLCLVFAHPDDESFSSGGTIARYADEGVDITLVTATRGEAGKVEGFESGSREVAELREKELREATGVLGVTHLRLLGLPDGKLEDRAEELQAAIRQALREVQPQVVITEDVMGITGHSDHIAVTRAVVRAYDELGDAAPLKLYEHVIPLSVGQGGRVGTPEDHITATLDVEPWRPRLIAALRSHRSQVPEETLKHFESGPPWSDGYVCVRSRVPILIPETDLFAGIPD